MSKFVRWETPFTDAFCPSVWLLAAKPFNLIVIVKPHEEDYPKYLIYFGEVLAFTCMEESCCPERDFSDAIFDEAFERAKPICAAQWLNSPWLKSYEGCHDPEGDGKYSHYLIFGGDNNVEVITANQPMIEMIEQQKILKIEYEI